MKNNLREKILNAIETDDSYSVKNENNIKKIYSLLNPTEKNKIDEIFINLCGYSLNTLLKSDETKKEDREIENLFEKTFNLNN